MNRVFIDIGILVNCLMSIVFIAVIFLGPSEYPKVFVAAVTAWTIFNAIAMVCWERVRKNTIT